jgi:hypothetical protein
VFEIGTDETKGLILWSPLHLIYPLDGVLVEDVAADAVEGVGWVGDDASISEGVDRPANEPLLGVLGMDLQDHLVTSIGEFSLLLYSRKSVPEAQGRMGEVEGLRTA